MRTRKSVFFLIFAVVLALVPRGAKALRNPHYGPILCTACHVDEEDYELREEDFALLCNSCHAGSPLEGNHHPLRKVPEEIQVPGDWPLQENALSCLTCHLPSHEENVGIYMFLRGDKPERPLMFCLNCHTGESWAGRNPHAEANEGKGCGFCHDTRPDPAADTLLTVTFCAQPSVLCMRCHKAYPHPAGFVHTLVLTAEQAKQLGDISLYRGTTIVCSTCHNPHIMQSRGHRLREIALEYKACPGCHTL